MSVHFLFVSITRTKPVPVTFQSEVEILSLLPSHDCALAFSSRMGHGKEQLIVLSCYNPSGFLQQENVGELTIIRLTN